MAADFKHPKENAAWKELSGSLPFQFVVDAFQGVYSDLTVFATMKGRCFLVTGETEPRLYRLYRIAAERLDVEEIVPLYLQMEDAIQIETVGTDDDCAILLNSACLEECSDKELLALLGRELAHIRYKHVRMLNVHKILDTVMPLIPVVGGAAAELFKTLLLYWRQYALYTADRGAAIAAQSADAVQQSLSHAMGMMLDGAGIDSILTSDAPDDGESTEMNMVGKSVLQLMMDRITVPFGVWRMKELKKWSASDVCRSSFPAVYFGTFSEFGLDRIDNGLLLYKQALVMEPHNQDRALAMLHAAANCGLPQAQARLGQYYLMGRGGLSKDLHTGLMLLREAALAGNATAWFGLGICFRSGCGDLLPKDEKQAQWMFRLAQAAGHPNAEAYVSGQMPKPIGDETATKAMSWFRSNFREGTCRINPVSPLQGLETDSAMRTYLWIPTGEKIYALESGSDLRGCTASAIAVTELGIYHYANKGIPFHMTWSEFAEQKMDGLRQGNYITLRINEMPFCTYRADSLQREIGALLLRIKTILDK